MAEEPTPEHHRRRRERRRRVKRLRGRPLGDLNVLPSFLASGLATGPEVTQATAAELGRLLDAAGRGRAAEEPTPSTADSAVTNDPD